MPLRGAPGLFRRRAEPGGITGVVGFERAERELPGAPVERIRAEWIGHTDDLSDDAGAGNNGVRTAFDRPVC